MPRPLPGVLPGRGTGDWGGGGESRREQETRRGEDLLTAGERAKELGEKEGRGFIGRNFPEKQSTCSRSDSKGRGGW